MFNKLSFPNTIDEFNKYKELKGEYLYKQIYDLLLELNSEFAIIEHNPPHFHAQYQNYNVLSSVMDDRKGDDQYG